MLTSPNRQVLRLKIRWSMRCALEINNRKISIYGVIILFNRTKVTWNRTTSVSLFRIGQLRWLVFIVIVSCNLNRQQQRINGRQTCLEDASLMSVLAYFKRSHTAAFDFSCHPLWCLQIGHCAFALACK